MTKKINKVILIPLLMAAPIYSYSANELTLYDDTALIGLSKEKKLFDGNFYIETPSSVMDNSFVVASNDDSKINKIHSSKNDFLNLLQHNIGEVIEAGEESGVLKDVRENFIILEEDSQVEKYISMSSLNSFSLPKNLPIDNHVYEVFTSSDKERGEFEYSYLFKGVEWSTKHNLFIGEDSELNYESNLILDNKTDISFNDVHVNLMAGEINISSGGSHRPMKRADVMMSAHSMTEGANFESFSGFQKMSMPEKTSLSPKTKHHIKFQSFNNVPHSKEYRFGNLRPRVNQDNIEVDAQMYIILERQDNEEFHFPFTAGDVGVYKGNKIKDSVLLTQQPINNHTKDEDIEINIGKSFDVDMNYSTNQISKSVEKLPNNDRERVVNIYEVQLNFKNNEPYEVKGVYSFLQSENMKEKIELPLSPESEVSKTYKLEYHNYRARR